MNDLIIDWQRSIFIDTTIDDDLVRKLTPKILAMRQESNAPITVGIDSPGGSTASLSVLLGLLTGPTQTGDSGEIVTVATNRAYSAAANLLAFGDYAVALKHSEILYHDVRYEGMLDITPAKALSAAKDLQAENDKLSLKLAEKVIRRLVWVHIDLKGKMATVHAKFPVTYGKFAKLIGSHSPTVEGHEIIQTDRFAATLWALLSLQNDNLIKNVMQQLGKWILLSDTAKSVPSFREKGSRTPGILDGVKDLARVFGKSSKAKPFDPQDALANHEASLKLLLTLLVGEFSEHKAGRQSLAFPDLLERATRSFLLIQSMDDPRHVDAARKLLKENATAFFLERLFGWNARTPEQQEALIAAALPCAQTLWLFCVLLCRELFEGEHTLNPSDAQLLGLIDEVAGGGPVESYREFVASRPNK